MKIKNFFLCAVAALGLSAAGNASAVSILQFGGSALLTPATPNTANQLSNFLGTEGEANSLSVISGSTGIFSGLAVGFDFTAGSPIIFDPANFSPNPLFTSGDFTFVLDPSTIDFLQGTGTIESLTVVGTGILSGPGFSQTADVSFSTSGVSNGGRISIQGNLVTPDMNVPEGGSAVLFLGLGMIGVETLRRKLAKA